MKDLIHICLKPEVQDCGMTFNRCYLGSVYPYFILYRGIWVYLFCRSCSYHEKWKWVHFSMYVLKELKIFYPELLFLLVCLSVLSGLRHTHKKFKLLSSLVTFTVQRLIQYWSFLAVRRSTFSWKKIGALRDEKSAPKLLLLSRAKTQHRPLKQALAVNWTFEQNRPWDSLPFKEFASFLLFSYGIKIYLKVSRIITWPFALKSAM